jgi:hypothetical protein
MYDRGRNLVRFPGSGPGTYESPSARGVRPASVRLRRLLNELSQEVEPPQRGRLLERPSGWLKFGGAMTLLYAAYLIGWSNAEPAQLTPPRHGITFSAVTATPAIQEPPTPLMASPPPAGRGLGNDEVREIQARLQALGHDPGPVDGLFGPQTVAAVKRYELANQLAPTGHVDLGLLERLRQEP